jgi:hypothetical protein
MISKNIGSMPP